MHTLFRREDERRKREKPRQTWAIRASWRLVAHGYQPVVSNQTRQTSVLLKPYKINNFGAGFGDFKPGFKPGMYELGSDTQTLQTRTKPGHQTL